jgi:hypothetical protein
VQRAKIKDKKKDDQYVIGTFVSVVFETGGTETGKDTSASDNVNSFDGNITVTKAQKLNEPPAN